MRIITGIYKGRHFEVPRSFKARPTTDFAKENLFNVLRAYVDFEECAALDLFGGTGSISLELVSRGWGCLWVCCPYRRWLSCCRRAFGSRMLISVIQASRRDGCWDVVDKTRWRAESRARPCNCRPGSRVPNVQDARSCPALWGPERECMLLIMFFSYFIC